MPIPVQPPTTLGTGGPGTPGDVTQPRLATLGDLVFGAVDQYGTLIYLTDVGGWSGSGGVTAQIEQRAADHGGWVPSSYLTARSYDVSLTLVGGSFALTEQSVALIAGGVPVGDLATLTVFTPGGDPLQADVVQGGDMLTSQKGAVAQMSISLVAPDPRRYSVEDAIASTGLPVSTGGLTLPEVLPLTIGATLASGVLTAVNTGNYATRPTLTVTGPCPPFQITHLETGKTLRFSDALTAGRSLVIDTDKRRVTLDGTASRTVTGTWFEYAPGTNTVSFTSSTYDAGATLTSQHRSAWR